MGKSEEEEQSRTFLDGGFNRWVNREEKMEAEQVSIYRSYTFH